MNIWATLEHAATNHGDSIAVVDGNVRRSYHETHARASALAHHLREGGVEAGSRVAVLAPNCAEFLESYYAAAGLGAILVPLNTRLAPPELAHILSHSEATVLIASSEFVELVARTRALGCPLAKVLWIGEPGGPVRTAPASGEMAYDDAIASAPGAFTPADAGADDVAQLYYTSGTTGDAKGVALTHANVSSHALGTISELQLEAADVWGHIAPMFHLADAWASFAITWVGGRHVTVPHFDEQSVLRTFEQEGITVTNLVPTMLQRLLNAPESQTAGFSRLRLLMSGGAPIAPAVVERVIATFGCEYVQTYGLTETSPYLTFSLLEPWMRELPAPEQLPHRARTGRPFVLAEVEVVDDAGDRVPADDETVGEIRARGPTVTPGYWHNAEATDAALRDGWLYTGDLATVDRHGFLQIVDRKKDMIITGGEKVYSTEVENVLYRHPQVLEAAVYGIPDDEWGESVRAAVVARVPGELDTAGLRAFCREHLAGYKVPRSIEVLEELPKTGSGKVRKVELRERAVPPS